MFNLFFFHFTNDKDFLKWDVSEINVIRAEIQGKISMNAIVFFHIFYAWQ